MTQIRCSGTRLGFAVAVVSAVVVALSACGTSKPTLAGIWQPDDGSGTKTINEDGSCSGMYYDSGKPLDIGGVATCTLGDKASDGAYSLVVRQPPNEATYLIKFDDDDTAVLMSGSGSPIVTLSRM
ncbi:hypothetical protein [Brevibacterium spongiae]|uniref:Lipoprotein n=1 Tax=Brevibacterium spongiae TaxID=2909672 RepID=A0ABY5SP62_9MICO|nr:hypothetical protein [Brevibacterium spongiae]UVI36345.1 hypothetical protein L1F31_01360 [Brevibacterium spongiae]